MSGDPASFIAIPGKNRSKIPKSSSSTAIFSLSPNMRASSPQSPPPSHQPMSIYSPQRHFRRPSSSGMNEDVDPGLLRSSRHHSVSAADLHHAPPLSASHQQQRPFFTRLISNKYTVTNPNFDFHHPNSSLLNLDNASVYSLELEEQQRRLDVISSLRPQRLIGNFKSLANWMDSYRHDVDKIKNKGLRKYYEEQNYLIERFTEIDNFLDAGKMHIKMLTTYGGGGMSDKSVDILDTHQEVEEESSPLDSPPHSPSIAAVSSPHHSDMSLSVDSETSFLMSNGHSNYHSHDHDDAGHRFEAEPLMKDDSKTSTLSKSRFNDNPGNLGEGAQFLGYDEKQDSQDVLVAILVNFFVNFVLLIGKIIVCVLTNSLSVVASLVDSILDFLSTFIIYIANRLSTTKNWQSEHAYPIGRSRLEPLGILIFSVIIIISFFQVGQESFKRLFLSLGEHEVVRIGSDAIVIMTLTIVSKICCWVWCAKSKSSSVQALAQDAMTDIVFNTVSLLMPTVGYFLDIWWLDPLGAFLLSIYVIASWSVTAFEHIDNLTGAVANHLDYKVILYLAYRFAESIKQISALKVYHAGDNLNVEIDVVFNVEDLSMSFKDYHDIAEALQYSIETLPLVERAYVHIDYMEGNFKGHLK